MSADKVVVVILDDDDDEEDDLQCVQVNDEGPSQMYNKYPSKKKVLQTNLEGFSKPSYSFPMMITQALALSPNMKSTALEICNQIAQKYPYYKFHEKPGNWRSSVFSCLTNRRKFFVIVGSTENGEHIWTFNPAFEKYMLNKWVPKYLRNKQQRAIQPTANVLEPATKNSAQISSTVNLDYVNPVIVSCETLNPQSDANEELMNLDTPDLQGDPIQVIDCNEKVPMWEPEVAYGEPEYVLADPDQIQDSNEKDPIDNESDSNTLYNRNESVGPQPAQTPFPIQDVVGLKGVCRDFTLNNLHFRHVITNDEINYRLHFNKEHTSIQKFRLHCTVCDVHLGTAPAYLKSNVRFHSNLGVLTCKDCYEATLVRHPVKGKCLWCMNSALENYKCSRCAITFCKACVMRNFGRSMVIEFKDGWECFFCVTKLIWPHRAIAYFLFRHYGDLKRKKNIIEKSNSYTELGDLGFWVTDQSTCCAPSRSSSIATSSTGNPSHSSFNLKTPNLPVVPRNLLQPTSLTNSNSVPSNSTINASNSVTASRNSPQSVVIGNRCPNRVFVKSARVPSVTLNTGTQYIHNVYPDKNYVVVQPSVSSSTRTALSVPTSNIPQPTISKPVMSTMTLSPSTYGPDMEDLPPNNPFTSLNIPSRISPLPDQLKDKRVILSSSTQNIERTILSGEKHSSLSTNLCIIRPNSQNILITPDNESFPRLNENISGIPHTRINSIDELTMNAAGNKSVEVSTKKRIINRPMPKCKKESLLKSLLLKDNGVETIKLKVQEAYNALSFPNCSNNESVIPERMEIDIVDEIAAIEPNSVCKNVEEPILKSIIESAMERLVILQKSQASASNVDNPSTFLETRMETDSNQVSVNERIENNPMPKIKIKTLKELQGSPNIDTTGIEISVPEPAKEIIKVDPDTECTNRPTEIDITDLKQGIIEASRTLINTQKRFKELAKTISSNTSYKSDQAIELIGKFKNILKSCRKQIDGINKNVQKQYESFIPTYCLDSILESFKGGSTVKNIKNCVTNETTGHEIIISPWNNAVSIKESDLSPKKSRDFVHINPLEKRNILGTPELTKEDLQQFPDSTWESSILTTPTLNFAGATNQPLTKKSVKRNSSLNCYKKRGFWSKKKRSSIKLKTNIVYKQNGTPTRAERNHNLESPLSVANKKGQKSIKTTRLPQRLSSRNHPSSAAYSAQDSSHAEGIVSYLPMNYVIKPCSVLIHRLDSRIVELLQKRAK